MQLILQLARHDDHLTSQRKWNEMTQSRIIQSRSAETKIRRSLCKLNNVICNWGVNSIYKTRGKDHKNIFLTEVMILLHIFHVGRQENPEHSNCKS